MCHRRREQTKKGGGVCEVIDKVFFAFEFGDESHFNSLCVVVSFPPMWSSFLFVTASLVISGRHEPHFPVV